MSETPSELRYAKTHEWARDEGDGTVTGAVIEVDEETLATLDRLEDVPSMYTRNTSPPTSRITATWCHWLSSTVRNCALKTKELISRWSFHQMRGVPDVTEKPMKEVLLNAGSTKREAM